jgi:hypothetical protein
LIERAVSEVLVLDEMKLEGSNIFRGYAIQWLFNEVREPPHMIGVRIDRGVGHISDHQILGQPLSDGARAFLVRCHGAWLSLKSQKR